MPSGHAADCRQKSSRKEDRVGFGFSVGRPNLSDARRLNTSQPWRRNTYGDDKKKFPKIYTVAYGADGAGEDFLKSLAEAFKGKFKRIRGLADPVKIKG